MNLVDVSFLCVYVGNVTYFYFMVMNNEGALYMDMYECT